MASTDAPCPTEECKARREIVCAADAYAHRLLPNTMAYVTRRAAQQAFEQWGRNIQALGQEHPKRIPLYCKLLTHVAATIKGTEAHLDSNGNRDWTAVNVIDMAVRLDRPGNGCLAQVMAAMPDTTPVREDGDVRYGRDCLRHIRTCQRSLDPPLR